MEFDFNNLDPLMATLTSRNRPRGDRGLKVSEALNTSGLTQLAHLSFGIRVKGQGEPALWAGFPTSATGVQKFRFFGLLTFDS